MLAHGAILGRAAGIPGKEHEQIHPLGDLSVLSLLFQICSILESTLSHSIKKHKVKRRPSNLSSNIFQHKGSLFHKSLSHPVHHRNR